jgi:hypothetical protein
MRKHYVRARLAEVGFVVVLGILSAVALGCSSDSPPGDSGAPPPNDVGRTDVVDALTTDADVVDAPTADRDASVDDRSDVVDAKTVDADAMFDGQRTEGTVCAIDCGLPDQAPCSTGAGDGAFTDALDSASDADTSPPDATTVPTFSNCTYTNAIAAVPYAIIDATVSGLAPASACTCAWMYAVAEQRVLCGSVPPERVVSLPGSFPGCLAPAPGRSIIIIRPLTCQSVEFMASSHPLQDWDALLAEQIAGHADSGSTDVGTDDGMARDSPADSASDAASPDSDSAAGD